jgi:hypothetical protein
MLFTDGDFINSADLILIDSQVASTAMAEKIQVDGGITTTACQEIGQRILSKSIGFAGTLPPFVAPWSQTAAALNLVGPSSQRPRISLSQIVTSTPYPGQWSAIKRATAYLGLVRFYEQAYHRKMEDRYEARMNLHTDNYNKRHWPAFWNQGTPIINQPMARPGAQYEPGVGIWGSGAVATVAGTNALALTSYDVAITWVDQRFWLSSTVKGNGESAPASTLTISVATAQVIQISITGLNGPQGQTPATIAQGQGLYTPLTASGWNVYVGVQDGPLYLQNATPVPYATKTYTLAGAPVLSGAIADDGQVFNTSFTMQNILNRG